MALKNQNLEGYVNLFLRRTNSPYTQRSYESAIKRFARWVPGKVEIDSGILFRDHLIKEGLNKNSINTYFVILKSFFVFLKRKGEIDIDPFEDVPLYHIKKGFLKDAFTKTDVQKIFNSIDISTLLGLRDFAIINLMARTGLREIEVSRSNVGDLEETGGKNILNIQRKGRDSKDDFVVLSNISAELIDSYLSASIKNDISFYSNPLFMNRFSTRLSTRSIRRIVMKYAVKSEIDLENKSVHSLRHFAATAALEGGASIIDVQKMLGHKNIQTTMIYEHKDRLEKPAEEAIVL